jgi:twitching motility protein PilT
MPQGIGALSGEDTRRLIGEICSEELMSKLDARGDLDFSTFLEIPGAPALPGGAKPQERYRCNVFKAGGGLHAAIRRVKPEIPSFESLGLPPIYRKLADETHEGLVLIVGVTGSGKSTTLACMLERINQTRGVNIITIEDPVEYHIQPRMSVVSQREIGVDVPDYGSALKYVVRQDPDVIFIGELRDHDTVMAAIQAAETGHLVFGSLHTADTAQTFSRLIEFFPQSEHAFVRSALAGSLKAVCAQRLLPTNRDVAHGGMIPATEVLLNNASVREKIRLGQDSDLPTIVSSCLGEGMRSFTHSLAELVNKELVKASVAIEFAPNPDALRSKLKGVELKTSRLVR